MIETWYNQDLTYPVKVQYLAGNVFSMDNNGNKVGVNVYENGLPVELSGSISANVIRADGGTVTVTGTASGNQAYVVLPQACYAVPGVISIVIKNTVSSDVTTLCAVVANVYQSSTDAVVDPGTIIPSIQALITQIETAVASIPADYSSLWTSIAPAFDNTKSYVAGQYVTYSGGLYRFTTAHSGSWAAADATAVNVGGELSDVKSALSAYNARDVLAEILTPTNETKNNVTFAWNGKVCTVSTTNAGASAITVNVLFNSQKMPDDISAGELYNVKYNTTDSNVLLRFSFFDGNGTVIERKYISQNASMRIPAGSVNWSVGLYVASGKVITTAATISNIALISAPTNQELQNELDNGNFLKPMGVVPNNTDIDDIVTAGCYVLDIANTYDHNPFPGIISELLVFYASNNTRVQIAYSQSRNEIKYRVSRLGVYPEDWYDQIPSTVTMQKFNAYDILAANYLLKRTSGTHNGITYAWDGDVCTVSGEASNISVNVLKSNDYLPEDVIPGETYYIKYTTTNPQVQLRIMWRNNSDVILERVYASVDMPVTVPASATKWTIGLYVEDGVDLDEDVTVSGIAFVSTMTNKELAARVGETGMTGQTYAASLWSWAVIGASFDSGEFNYKLTAYPTFEDAQAQTNGFTYNPEIDDFRYACWDMFKRMNGISDLYIYANGGQNARDWIHPSGASEARKHVYDTDTEELATPNGYYDGNNVWHFYYVHDTADGWTYNDGTYTKGGNIAPYRTGIGHGGGTWAKMLADYRNGVVKQVFVVNLGSNDINNNYPHNDDWSEKQSYDATKFYTCGSNDDIGTYDLETDTDTVPEGKTEGVVPGVVNSYAAYIGAILNRIIAIQPGALILLCTIRRGFSSPANKAAVWAEYNNMLKAIAADDRYKNNVVIIDNGTDGPDYGSAPMTSMIVGYHPNAIGYQYIARFWNTEINNALWANYTKPVIKQGMFIGTGKSF